MSHIKFANTFYSPREPVIGVVEKKTRKGKFQINPYWGDPKKIIGDESSNIEVGDQVYCSDLRHMDYSVVAGKIEKVTEEPNEGLIQRVESGIGALIKHLSQSNERHRGNSGYFFYDSSKANPDSSYLEVIGLDVHPAWLNDAVNLFHRSLGQQDPHTFPHTFYLSPVTNLCAAIGNIHTGSENLNHNELEEKGIFLVGIEGILENVHTSHTAMVNISGSQEIKDILSRS